ncbi:MAG: division/cell wall cluster transcriptional repressor MraZ [candidate division WOR-3 bacterium]
MGRPRFFGEHEYTVDAKGRVAIPVAFRKKLGPGEETFFLVPGRDMTIEVHPLPGWDEYENRTLRQFPEGKRETQRVKRFLYGRGTEATLDSQGRILLPQRLRERAGITNEVVFAGVGDFFEIWEPSRYRKFMEEADKSYDEDRNVASLEGKNGGCEHGSAGANVPRTGDGQ